MDWNNLFYGSKLYGSMRSAWGMFQATSRTLPPVDITQEACYIHLDNP
jgi:hypothetical protein